MPALYDTMADWFDQQTDSSFYNAHYDRPAVLDVAGDVRGLRIADLGCGPGVYLADLRERGADVIGVDGSAELLARARARVGADVELHQHDLEQPLHMFDDESLDGVVSALVYHYIHNRMGVLREIRRALRPGGWLVLSTSHPVADWLDAGGSYFAVEWTEACVRSPWRRMDGAVLADAARRPPRRDPQRGVRARTASSSRCRRPIANLSTRVATAGSRASPLSSSSERARVARGPDLGFATFPR